MKVWVEYYETKTMSALGDRAIVQLDGRQKMLTWIKDGHQFNGFRRPVYAGFKIIRGDSLMLAQDASPFITARN